MGGFVLPAIQGGLGILGGLFGNNDRKHEEKIDFVDWFGNPWGQDAKDNHLFNSPQNHAFWQDYGFNISPDGTKAMQSFPGTDLTVNFNNDIPENPLGDLRNNMLDLLESQINDYNSFGDGGFDMPNFNIHAQHVGAAHMSPSHYSPTHAAASLIDMLDQAFQAEPNANLREDVYSRLKSGAFSGAEDNIRKIKDAARNAGAGPNAPWAQQLMSEARTRANQDATQGLTDFFDSYVTAALARRSAALSQNSETQTNVNMFNASADNTANQFNAASNNQAAQFNAASSNQANALNAQLALQAALETGSLNLQSQNIRNNIRAQHLGQGESLLHTLFQLTQPIRVGASSEDGGGKNWAAALSQLVKGISDSIKNGKDGEDLPEGVWV